MGLTIDKIKGPLIHGHKELKLLYNEERIVQVWNSLTGTTGTVTVPKLGGGVIDPTKYSIELNRWEAGIDGIITTISSGQPTGGKAVTAAGATITTTLDAAGAYVLSGIPSAYPVAIVFFIKIKAIDGVLIDPDYVEDRFDVYDFLELGDVVPSTFAAQGNQLLMVNTGATGVDFSGTGLTYTKATNTFAILADAGFALIDIKSTDADGGVYKLVRNNNNAGWYIASMGGTCIGSYAFGLANPNAAYFATYGSPAFLAIGSVNNVPVYIGQNNVVRETFLIGGGTNRNLTEFNYLAALPTADAVGDWRYSNQAGTFKIDYATGAHATKGAGTWVTRLSLDITGNLQLINNVWYRGLDFAGTGFVNMFKTNVSNEIDCGGTLNISGNIEFPTDGGALTWTDMAVTAATGAGVEMSYTMRIDANNMLKIYAESDGAGGIKNKACISYGSFSVGALPVASAIIDAQSTTQGIRFPNMTTVQRNAIATPAIGLVVFDTDLDSLFVKGSAAWIQL